jgi:monofunctional biosynthetic peptidoglycan transglycosylase
VRRFTSRLRARAVGRWLLALTTLGFAYLIYIYLTLPDVRVLATSNPSTTAFIELRKREAAEAGRRLVIRQRWVPYTQISSNLRRAVVVTEDSAFFDHDGIDITELRASFESNWEEGRFTRGGSTITQQLAKNLYLSPSRNPIRKLKELLITRRLEAALSKRRILEIYLNVIEWGDGIFGAEAAARSYFGKPASMLTTDEAALLAGAIINPREHSPARPTRRLLRRQQIIVRRMGIKPDPPPPTSTAETPHSADTTVGFSPINQSPPEPLPAAQSVQKPPVNGSTPPVIPPVSENTPGRNAAGGAVRPPQPRR